MPHTAAQTDLEQIMQLNHDYVRSVQEGDVDWFAEHLAHDFLASNPDGSLVDKPRFLTQTARPVTISGLIEDDVRVRLLDNVAIVHARTTYRAADGSEHHGRYTDVWANRDGQWLAIAAHVTR